MPLLASCIHLLTASGAVFGLLTLRAISASEYREAFLWMFAAVALDAIDGPLARLTQADRVLPRIDGRVLDDIVDYLNYVIAPAWLLLHSGILPAGWELATTGLVVIASGLGFANVEAKTADQFFTGFPSYWNIVTFYLLSLRPAPWLASAIVVALAVLVLVPFRSVYPSRTLAHRRLTLALTGAWCILLAFLVIRYPHAPPLALHASLLYPLYYAVVSFELNRRGRARGSPIAGDGRPA